jgi:hypothetical protein
MASFVPLLVRFPESVLTAIRERADVEHTSMTRVVVDAVEAYLARRSGEDISLAFIAEVRSAIAAGVPDARWTALDKLLQATLAGETPYIFDGKALSAAGKTAAVFKMTQIFNDPKGEQLLPAGKARAPGSKAPRAPQRRRRASQT